MESISPVTIKDLHEGDAHLDALQLDRDRLIAAGHHAMAGRASASPLHPSNTAGFLSYADGVKGLRAENIGDDWQLFRSEGVEGICNEELKLRVLFANVFEACGEDDPQARSRKGAGSERVACGDMFEAVGVELPLSVIKFSGDYKTYYLMVDQHGAMELSLPIVKAGGNFLRCVERIFLIGGNDLDEIDFGVDEPADDSDLDIIVTRK
ncbi:hypothetical protein [Parasedimentitalea psychrophila]|uniref:Uncharacterized protein n=1 Tax=Parasedimentitalea psychrophila TaxID=2997337 RepID=A0A9Y2L3P5_9RHOB|nr:hypothetical protein [Parasedimentitalea psychrophila]WIY27385.1 hypothetical protein QPJ95_10990 [Parasedimentitalea psychrophila]